jgi:O-antigen chain-terminating methyltransferase
MTDVDPPGDSIDDLLDKLRQKVADRKANGLYPADFEAQLDAHFERIAVHRVPTYEFGVIRERLQRLQALAHFSPANIEYKTRIPGGSLVHRLVGKLVSRQTSGLLEQFQRHANALNDFAGELTDAIQHPKIHEHAELAGEIHMLLDRMAEYERAASGEASVAGLQARVEAIEETLTGKEFSPWFSNERFEEAFRGESGELRERYKDLARHFLDCGGEVVDVGCGRGEFLQLLTDLGVKASGLEIDPDLVASAVDRNLPVEYGDLVPWLEQREVHSLSGLALIQVVEHLEPQELSRFVALAAAKLAPEGKVVVETVNPQSLYVYAHSFYLDPTHKAPVHPAYLMFLFQEAGFSRVDIEWRSPCPPDDILEGFDGGSELEKRLDANVERLNRLLFAEQDYALIAVR